MDELGLVSDAGTPAIAIRRTHDSFVGAQRDIQIVPVRERVPRLQRCVQRA